jgi:hypothetical protein
MITPCISVFHCDTFCIDISRYILYPTPIESINGLNMKLTINHTKYSFEECQFGWVWLSGRNESELVFATACEAQQSAIDNEQSKIVTEEEAHNDAFNEQRYGTYEQQHALHGEGY